MAMMQKKYPNVKLSWKGVRRWVFSGILLIILSGICLEIMLEWRALNGYWEHAGLRYESGGLTGEQIEEYQKKQRDSMQGEDRTEADIAAWKRESNQTVSVEKLGRSADGTVIWVSGAMELVFPCQRKEGGFPVSEDLAGCVISSGLAWELYGTTDVVGNALELGGKELVVRGVLEQKEPLLALVQKELTETLPYVEIRTRGRAPAPVLSQIAGSLGLFGEAYVFHGSLYVSLARLLISLPLWCLYFWMGKRFLKWCKSSRWLRFLGKGILLAGIGAGIFLSVSFTPDFIPARWSDFEFWARKLSELAGWVRARRDFPEIYWEAEVLGCLRRVGAGALVLAGGIVGAALRRRWGRKSREFALSECR